MINPAHVESIRKWVERRGSVLRRIALAGIVVSVFGIMWAMPMAELATQLRGWSQQENGTGGLLFVGSFVILTVLSLPVWPMPLVAGAAFGKLWGTLLASGSCVLAAAVTFLIARGIRVTALRRYLESSPRMRALENTVGVGNWKIVAAVRMSHLLPFGMQNYGFGLTKMKFWIFCLTTWLVTLPGTFVQVWLGDLGFESIEAWQKQAETDWTPLLLQAGGVVVLVGALLYIGYLGKTVYWDEAERQLNRNLELEEQQQGRASWPVGTLLLTGMMLVFVSLASWCVVEHETLRQFVSETL